MALMRVNGTIPGGGVPIGRVTPDVRVFGYGMRAGQRDTSLNDLQAFVTQPLSQYACTSITQFMDAYKPFVCLAHGNASICHGDSGGGMVSSDGYLVAVNDGTSLSTPNG